MLVGQSKLPISVLVECSAYSRSGLTLSRLTDPRPSFPDDIPSTIKHPPEDDVLYYG